MAIFGFVGCGGKTTTEGGGDASPAASATQGANPDAGKFDPSGTYKMENTAVGTVATLKVTKAGDQFSYTLDASVGNAAEMSRSATMVSVADKKYEDNDDACQISFTFGNGNVDLAYLGGGFEGCGEVDCAGSYTKQ